jgi:diguanylate cyclase (GGDEF)-like protein
MSNRESDRVERILDLAAKGQTTEALAMLQEAEASQTEEVAAELAACRKLLNGVNAIHAGRFEAGLREALPALTYLEQHFRRLESQYRDRLAAVARNAEIFAELERTQLTESEARPSQDEWVAMNQPHEQPSDAWNDEALRDTLTGCLNQRGLTLSAQAFFTPGKRMAFAMADIDHFKSTRDRYGHEASDKVLQSIAQIFKKSLRDSDLVARRGEDEFVLLISGVEGDAAWGTCERLRLAVERYGWGTIAPSLRTTISLGLAVRMEDEDMDALASTAENALSQAKETGRNRVVAG